MSSIFRCRKAAIFIYLPLSSKHAEVELIKRELPLIGRELFMNAEREKQKIIPPFAG